MSDVIQRRIGVRGQRDLESREILSLLRTSVDDMGQTIVMVTHDATAAAVADRVLFLRDGLLVEDDSHLETQEILDRMKELGS